MIKISAFVLVLAVCINADDTNSEKNEGGRQKRLLFFDEGGTLVKTYSNPYLNNLALNSEKVPYYGNFLNPFFNFIRAFGNSLAAFTIPVSNAIIQQIKIDPIFQSSLVVVPKEPVVEPNPLCEGMRTQVPSPSICNNFLNCWDGWAVEQECPTGLLFSNSGYCDYADNVDCRNRKLNVDKLQPQPDPVCSKDFEAFRNKLDCSEFFVCVNRQPVKFKCPADLAYSQYLGVCDYPDRVDCKSTAGPAIPPFQPQPPSDPSTQPPSNPPIPSPSNPQTQPPSYSPQPPLNNPPVQPPSKPQTQPPSYLPAQPPSNPQPQQPSYPNPPPFPNPITLPFPSSVGPIPIPASLETPSLPLPPSSNLPPSFPSNIPPEASIPPGSPNIQPSPVIPPVTSDLRPSFFQPSPPGSFPLPVESMSVPADKPGFGIFTPGCATASVAMSRQDAIRQLQKLN